MSPDAQRPSAQEPPGSIAVPPAEGCDPDTAWMRLALQQAQTAAARGEVPVGAVVVHQGRVVGKGCNAPIGGQDPTAHAEIVALRAAACTLGNYRLDGCTLYVTLEPCTMCSGAILHARLSAVVYGAADPRTGAAGSVLDVFAERRINHHTTVRGGVMADECADLLQAFFRDQRARRQQAAEPLRDDALRTPETAFSAVPPRRWPSRYRADLPALGGLRMHWIDTGAPASGDTHPAGDAGRADGGPGTVADRTTPTAWLCLHGAVFGSRHFDGLADALVESGARVLVPDMVGFGRSDKPKREELHTPAWHAAVLAQWIESLGVASVVVVSREGDGAWATTAAAALGERLVGWWQLAAVADAHAEDAAAFPDRGHRAGPRAVGRWPLPETAHGIAGSLPKILRLVDGEGDGDGTGRSSSHARVRAVQQAMEYFAR